MWGHYIEPRFWFVGSIRQKKYNVPDISYPAHCVQQNENYLQTIKIYYRFV